MTRRRLKGLTPINTAKPLFKPTLMLGWVAR